MGKHKPYCDWFHKEISLGRDEVSRSFVVNRIKIDWAVFLRARDQNFRPQLFHSALNCNNIFEYLHHLSLVSIECSVPRFLETSAPSASHLNEIKTGATWIYHVDACLMRTFGVISIEIFLLGIARLNGILIQRKGEAQNVRFVASLSITQCAILSLFSASLLVKTSLHTPIWRHARLVLFRSKSFLGQFWRIICHFLYKLETTHLLWVKMIFDEVLFKWLTTNILHSANFESRWRTFPVTLFLLTHKSTETHVNEF